MVRFSLHRVEFRNLFSLTGISAPIFGMICDRKPPKSVSLFGGILVAISFLLMGPAPFIPLQKSIGLIVVSLIIHGEWTTRHHTFLN